MHMKTIQLSRGKVALIDDVDAELMSRFKWHAHKSQTKWYAMTDLGTFRRTMLYMHRLIIRTRVGEIIDHINGNGLDNRRSNLRICTLRQNLCFRPAPKNNRSGFKGVGFDRKSKKWRASITSNRKWFYLGLFDSKKEAALAYDSAAKEKFGEFAFLNFPD